MFQKSQAGGATIAPPNFSSESYHQVPHHGMVHGNYSWFMLKTKVSA